MTDHPCVICESKLNHVNSRGTSAAVECPRCGHFSITYSAAYDLDRANLTARQRANGSGWIREHQQILIDIDDLPGLLAVKTPSFSDRVDKLLAAIDTKIPSLGGKLSIDENGLQLMSESWCHNREEFSYLVVNFMMNEAGYLRHDPLSETNKLVVSIAPKGYARLDALSTESAPSSHMGFCAMWFDDSVKPIWTQAIEPAILSAGYEPIRIDGHQHNNRIDDEIIALIRRSKFVVADFTGQRGGVYFEAGYALGHGLPVIWTVRKDDLEEVHFDNRQYNFLLWAESDLGKFKTDLQNRIEATLGRGSYKQGS